MKMALLAIVISLVAGSCQQAVAQKCLKYWPSTVTLTGKLYTRNFPGPPNYESIRKGDLKETALLLALTRKVCTDGNVSDVLSFPERNVRNVQLVIHNKGHWKIVRRLNGKHASVRGTLFHAHTGHHRTKVLIEVISIKAAK